MLKGRAWELEGRFFSREAYTCFTRDGGDYALPRLKPWVMFLTLVPAFWEHIELLLNAYLNTLPPYILAKSLEDRGWLKWPIAVE